MFLRTTRGAQLVFFLALAVALPAGADYEAGQRSLDAGEPAAALEQWRTAAAAGDAQAMLGLGRLYLQGLGVLQDYVEAHKWFNLAASRGEADGARERDALAEKMTPQQVATAQERAAGWQPEAVEAGATAEPPEAAETSATAEPPPGSETEPPAPADPEAVVAPLPPSPEDIREAQELLGALGYSPGLADGKWGARSIGAYRTFLRDASMPAADSLSREALQALRDEANRRQESQEATAAPGPSPAADDSPGAGMAQSSTAPSAGETIAAAVGFVLQGIYALQLVELIETPEDFARLAPELQKLLTQMFSGLAAANLAGGGDEDIALGVLTETERNRLAELLKKDDKLPEPTRAALSQALASAGVAAGTKPVGPNWIVAENQPCQLHNSNPIPNETVTWSGGCVDGKAHGEGRWEWRTPEGLAVYVGSMRAGRNHGRAVYTHHNGAHYEGDYVDGKLHGQGVMTYLGGNRYEGDWRDSKRTGQGVFTWASGVRYEGDWRDGKEHGQGVETWPDGSIEFEGEWRYGVPVREY